MKIGLLTFASSSSVRAKSVPKNIKMLREEIKKLGYKAYIIKFDKCQLVYDRKGPRVLYGGKKFPNIDVLIPRVGTGSRNMIKASVVKQIQMMGIPCVNDFLPIVRAKNKLRTLQILAHKGIPIPKTVVVSRFEYLDAALRQIGTMPVILKTSYGSLGVGVAIVESRRSLISSLDILWQQIDNDIILLQEYIKESEGKDLRVFVVGGRIVASMQRTAKEGDFRSNIHQGGTGEIVKLTSYERKLALNAVKALNLDVAGVDLLEKKGGAVVMEINCNPGLEGITEATGINVAKEIVKFALEKAKTKRRIRRKTIFADVSREI